MIASVLDYDARDFANLVRRLHNDAARIGLPEEYVPASCFWLVNENKTLVGVSHFGHSLNAALRYEGGHIGYSIRPTLRNRAYGKLMLGLLLERVKAQGVTEVLLTCDKTNMASASVIQGNGGKLDSEVPREGGNGVTRRYWIHLS